MSNQLIRSSSRLAKWGLVTFAALPMSSAQAHVKWFAPYIVGAAPQPIWQTMTNVWFWTGILLVLFFFMATRMVETSHAGNTVLSWMDRVSEPLWTRLDDFMRVVIGAFFVAIFSVGGIYLTPDLQTPAEWVSWLQLLIALGVLFRRTMPLSAASIILLWLLALRDYSFFHLLDYLALGVAIAAYLVLAASTNEELRKHRFEVLRWGVAIALMWSSLEKFAYPEWFYPLVEQKPFLTFGIPRDMFIPMAGVAEFTMGFGLLWTPLVRRLSAIALFVIFNAAVYPFGRIDLIGHALIMAIIVAIAVDHTRELHFLAALRGAVSAVPFSLAGALLIFFGLYWGLHAAFYGEQPQSVASNDRATHVETSAPSPDIGNTDRAMLDDYQKGMTAMRAAMAKGIDNSNPDVAYLLGMIPHHQGAVDMSKVELKYGASPRVKELARHIIAEQRMEIGLMKDWAARMGSTAQN